jgi:hypothetical protein
MWNTVWQALMSLFRSPREPYVPSPEPFLKLDVDALRAELQPTQRGELYGTQNLPPSDATFPDTREAEISRFCQEELDRSHVQITKGIDTHIASIRQLSGNSADAEISQLRDSALSELQSVAQNVRNRLELTLQHADEATEAFRRFREVHRRESLPDLSRGQLLPFAIFTVMIAIESALNGNMFAQGNDFGLLGGVFQAAMFSIANVGAGGLTGVFGVRQLYHVSLWKRFAGGLAFGAAICLAVILNLGVAHFRDAMVRGIPQNEAATSALQALFAEPFALADLFSWLLFGLGFVFFWIACYDGFRLDDPYPSYGAEYRRVLHAKQAYSNAVTETHRAMAIVRDTYTRRISDVAKRRDVYAHHLTSLYDRIARLTNSYERHCQSVRAIHRLLIEEYRDANRRKRTLPPPAYFSAISDVEPKPVPVYTAPGDTVDVGPAAAAAVSALTDMHDREIRTLVTVAQLGGNGNWSEQLVH